ncbi:MAG: hypothetical protein JNK82_40465 [Myxococcaceae bacterium]|nr:hypothetical protein [Myxococcaceae bacterium]
MRRLVAMIVVYASSCSAPPPQAAGEASITYKLKFVAGPADNTRVIFPLPVGPERDAIMAGIMTSDGGSMAWVEQGDAGPGATGLGAALDGRGEASATYFVKALSVGGGSGLPDVNLSMRRPDGGPGELYLRVNKSGASIVTVEYELTASRDCGAGCGGTKSWKFSGDIGTALQPVDMTYVEEKR